MTLPDEAIAEFGGLAQLARALDLHSRGHRFDSDILHNFFSYYEKRGISSNNRTSVFLIVDIHKLKCNHQLYG